MKTKIYGTTEQMNKIVSFIYRMVFDTAQYYLKNRTDASYC